MSFVKYWTDYEVKILTKLWSNHTATEIAERLGRSRGSIIGKVTRLGLKK